MGGITTLDDARQLQDFITAGLTPEEHHRFLDLQGGAGVLRLPDQTAGTAAAGGLLRPHQGGGPSRDRLAAGAEEIVIQAPDEEGPHAPQGDSTFPPLELTPGEG